MSEPISIKIDFHMSDPYVNKDGKLCVTFTVMGQSFERQLDYSKTQGRMVYLDPTKTINK